MKKTVVIIIIALLVVGCIIGGIFVLTANSKDADTKPTTNTVSVTEKPTQVETQAPTQAPTQASTQTTPQTNTQTDSNQSSGNTQTSDDTEYISDIRGTWKHEINAEGCSVQVVDLNGNDIELLITSMRGNASQIATARVNVSLDTFNDSGMVRGTGSFEYTDSFENSGTGRVSVSDNVITLVIEEQYNSGSDWGISNATGDYYFYSNEINWNEYNF